MSQQIPPEFFTRPEGIGTLDRSMLIPPGWAELFTHPAHGLEIGRLPALESALAELRAAPTDLPTLPPPDREALSWVLDLDD